MKKINQDPLLFKIASLALDKDSPDGEWKAAAVKFFSRLRHGQVSIDELLHQAKTEAGYKFAKKKERFRAFDGRMPFGKYKDVTIIEILKRDAGYCEWLMSIECDPAIKAEILRVSREYGKEGK